MSKLVLYSMYNTLKNLLVSDRLLDPGVVQAAEKAWGTIRDLREFAKFGPVSLGAAVRGRPGDRVQPAAHPDAARLGPHPRDPCRGSWTCAPTSELYSFCTLDSPWNF
ncbi:hypothetical protein H0H81_000213 [Sphagnurus paluster]|uniref:Uncharacterized protein n=1 Tax=Sphagnurus paluster TaxID=117069 RepID=A0A9P7GKJ5_9AGAR|nr:hypothetical protein H0H81_000213 [Sphagnurus paluster]